MRNNTKVVLSGLRPNDLIKFFPGPPPRALIQEQEEDSLLYVIDLITGTRQYICAGTETMH